MVSAKPGPAHQAETALPPLGAHRGRQPRLHHNDRSRPLPADQNAHRQQRGAKVAQIDLARRLAEAIWHILTREQPFASKGAIDALSA